MKAKHCQWCDLVFESKITYQVYCSVECRDLATKEKIAARYLLVRRSRRIGKTRKCKQCDQNLSIYNDEQLCSTCDTNPKDVTKALKDIKGFLNGKDL